MNLLEISTEYRSIIVQMDEWAEEHEGDVSGFNLLERLGAIEGDLKTKVLNIACLIKELNAEGKAIVDLGQSIVSRGTAKINRAKSLKEYIEGNLPTNAKYEDERARVNWQNNGGVEAVEILPEIKPEDFPKEFHKPPVILLNTDAIREKAEDLGNGKKGIKVTEEVPANSVPVESWPEGQDPEGTIPQEKILAFVFRGKHVRIK